MNVKNKDNLDNILEEESDNEEDIEEDEKENLVEFNEDDEEEDDDDEEDYEVKENEKNNIISSKIVEDEFSEGDIDTEDEEDEEIDDKYLQKFNEVINTKILEDMHPEIKSINYDEMIALAKIVRDKNGNIIDPLHKTIPLLTKYEKARIIGARAEQLDAGSEAYIPLDETIINGKTIALMEFEQKKIPFIIARPLSNGSTEYWHVSDLENILD